MDSMGSTNALAGYRLRTSATSPSFEAGFRSRSSGCQSNRSSSGRLNRPSRVSLAQPLVNAVEGHLAERFTSETSVAGSRAGIAFHCLALSGRRESRFGLAKRHAPNRKQAGSRQMSYRSVASELGAHLGTKAGESEGKSWVAEESRKQSGTLSWRWWV